jgi:hypothetical protein
MLGACRMWRGRLYLGGLGQSGESHKRKQWGARWWSRSFARTSRGDDGPGGGGCSRAWLLRARLPAARRLRTAGHQRI